MATINMSEPVKELYQELHDIANKRKERDNLGVMPTTFAGKPERFVKGLPMFIGRDTLGLGMDRIIAHTTYNWEELGNPEKTWLRKNGGYYFGTSPFWRTIGRALAKFRSEAYNVEIFHDLLWSDLYKVNFRTKLGTTPGLRAAQLKTCANLLLAEMDDLRPSTVIFLTGTYESGKGVDPFLSLWKAAGKLASHSPAVGEFELTGTNGNTHRCLVVPHPARKKQAPIIQRIVDFMQKS